MHIRRHALVLLPCLLSLACSRSNNESDDESGGGMQVCECIVVEGDEAGGSDEPMLPTCGSESCRIVEASSANDGGTTDTGGEGGSFVLDNPEALECALEALRDRTPMLLRWHEDIDSGFASDSGYLLIRADGLAVRRSLSWEDLGGWVSDALLGELNSAEHYQACLDDPDDLARLDCLRAALADTQQVCDVGWTVGFL